MSQPMLPSVTSGNAPKRQDSFASCYSAESDLEYPPEREEDNHEDHDVDDEALMASFVSVKSIGQPGSEVLSWLGLTSAPGPEDWEFRKGAQEHGWDSGDASGVKIRGPTYSADRRKEEGGPAMFETVCVDLFMVTEPTGIPHISARDGGVVKELRRCGENRFLFVVNWTMPPMQIACVFAAPASWPPDPVHASNAEKMAWSFCNDMSDDERRSVFKVIPWVSEGPWLVQKALGRTPAIIGSKIKVDFFHEPGDHLEVSVDIFSSPAARRVLGLLQGAAKILSMEVYMLLEGRSDEELPERILGAFRVNHPDVSRQRGP
eukprot:CAMPEP_0195135930 /NCGR_PEP_ID=MMETSP0448-20130528/153324_1 /TAXON_ID=66468 /ORGANISM="Heterocapsa triquestra, Strain CCMP 448" /LENGTH=318 /DNA_ID=CAMNT_0040174093 /DNA_START=11 /DNA_END=963 /DNA_ORIENTATION=-